MFLRELIQFENSTIFDNTYSKTFIYTRFFNYGKIYEKKM